MKNKLYHAFDELKAEEQLKENTLLYLKQYNQKPKKKYYPRKALAFICTVMFLIAGTLSYKVYFTPSSYLDIDINPSLEIVINSFGRVIDTFAYNEEGEKILDNTNIKHKSYEAAVVLLINTMENEGYLVENGLLSVTVQSEKTEERILTSVEKQIDGILDDKSVELEQEVYAVDADTRTHAHESGISPAKYLAILELIEVDSSITIEECQEHSIRELREYTKQHGNGHHNEGSDAEEENNNRQNGSEGHNSPSGGKNKKHR